MGAEGAAGTGGPSRGPARAGVFDSEDKISGRREGPRLPGRSGSPRCHVRPQPGGRSARWRGPSCGLSGTHPVSPGMVTGDGDVALRSRAAAFRTVGGALTLLHQLVPGLEAHVPPQLLAPRRLVLGGGQG